MARSLEVPRIALKINRRSAHPWIFRKMVEQPEEPIPRGAVVDVFERSGRFVGRGLWNAASRITIRLLTEDRDEKVDNAFFARRIAAAVGLRRDVLGLDAVTDAYRLVHSEADGLSGLVVDRYGAVLVVELHAAGMLLFREAIDLALLSHFPGARATWFADEVVQRQESIRLKPPPAPPPAVIQEHGLRFRVAPGGKHKTGFFLDQRDNRRALAALCRGKRVLDLCCNSGGFSIYARALGEASHVTGVDLDETALSLAEENARLNAAEVRFVHADLFPWLRDCLRNERRFDVVVLDPAKQTRDRDAVDEALGRYLDMNRLAIQAVAPGGLLLTCSCTGLVSEEQFLDMLRRASFRAGRNLQVLRVSGAAPDHPFSLFTPEGRYLKAVLCRVV